jgi:hypothetical protein
MYQLYPKFLVLSVRCVYQFISLTLLKHDRFSVCLGFNSLTNEHSSTLRSLNSMSCAIISYPCLQGLRREENLSCEKENQQDLPERRRETHHELLDCHCITYVSISFASGCGHFFNFLTAFDFKVIFYVTATRCVILHNYPTNIYISFTLFIPSIMVK